MVTTRIGLHGLMLKNKSVFSYCLILFPLCRKHFVSAPVSLSPTLPIPQSATIGQLTHV